MRLITALGRGLLACVLPMAAPAAGDAATSEAGREPVLVGSAGTVALVEAYGYPYWVELQYRGAPRPAWSLRHGIGIGGGPDGMAYFFADLAHDFALPRRWFVTLSLAGGVFHNGDEIGVNDHLQFRSGLAVSHRLENGARVGLAGYHISNGGFSSPNNGTEALVLFLALPLRQSR